MKMLRLLGSIVALVAIAATANLIANAQTVPPQLAAFAKAWAGLNGYHTTAHAVQESGAKSQNSVYDYTFGKPSSISMNIVSGPNAGASVTWGGGTTVRAGKGMFTKTVSLKDPLVTSLRGQTIVDLSFGSILKHAEKLQGKMASSTTQLGGATVDAINVTVADPAKDHGLTHEAIYLSTTTNLPVRVDGFIGAELVQTISFSDTTTR
jgi:outer membrane lipoprotein-sorting protein